MKVLTLFVILVSLVFPASVFAAAQGTELQQDPGHPNVAILGAAADAIDLIVRFPANPLLPNDPEKPDSIIFDETLYGHPADVGVPDLPVLSEEVEIPAGDAVSIEILDSKSSTALLGDEGLPSTIPTRAPEVEKCSAGELCSLTQPFSDFQAEGVFPASPAEMVNTYIVRGHQVAQLQFWPVQYDPASQSVVIYEEITLRIVINAADTRDVAVNSAAYTSPAFEELLSTEVLNYSQPITVETDRSTGGEGYLIIAPDAFVSTLAPLVSLKEYQGFTVTVAALSTTGSTTSAIKSYIQTAYDTWPVPPTYVLLVGDIDNGSNSMPAFTGESSQTVTDLYYGTVDGTDWIPDVFIGRLPARTTSQLTTMINNLAAYDALSGMESWVKKAALLASNDANYWDTAEATQNYVISTHTQPASYTGTFPSSPQAGGDKLYAYTYSASNANVLNSINNSRSLISYTGHGSQTSWGGPYFSQSNIRGIASTGVFSVVTSFACLTGDFAVTESFGETWMLQSNKAAIAFIGSSASTYWGPDDIMERAMMDSLYSGADSATVVGAFTYAGLMAVEANRPGTGTAQSRYYWESYNILGDPSLEMVTGPKNSDFTLSVEPSTVAVCQSSESTATVSLSQTNGFDAPVTLSLTGIPAGITAGLSANPVTPPNVSLLTFASQQTTPTGEYSLTLSGDGDGKHHEFNLGLTVFDGIPAPISLTSPANAAADVSSETPLVWQAAQAGQTFEIQVAFDSAFTQIAYTQSGLSQTSFTPSGGWDTNALYYWRVRAINPCGTGNYSPVYQFMTELAPGECPNDTAPLELYQTGFEAADPKWTHTGTTDTWTRSTNRFVSPSYAYYSVDKNLTNVQYLTSPTVSIPNTYGEPVILKFSQWFNIEANTTGCFDGALLQISNNNGQSWSQVPSSLLLTTPYAGAISSSYGNPLGGNQAWCGYQDWSETVVDLTQYAGQDVQLRFAQGSDASIGLEGWYIDNFSMIACEAKPDYRPYLNTSAVTAGQAPGQEAVIRLQLTNAGANPDTYIVDLTNSVWIVSLKTRDVIELLPGQTTVLEISIFIPEDAEYGQIEQILLSVTSQNDPASPPAVDQTTIDLMASMLNYIPVVNQN